MARKPLLNNYPHLHQLLRNDPVANSEFNQALSVVSGNTRLGNGEFEQLERRLEASETNLQQQLDKNKVLEASNSKSLYFIKLMGEAIESQLRLTPYSTDIVEGKKYTIELSARQVRTALRLHWDVLGQAMEESIGRTLLLDPALDREKD